MEQREARCSVGDTGATRPLRARGRFGDTGTTLHIVCPESAPQLGGDEFKQCEGWHHACRSEKREKASLAVFDVRARFKKCAGIWMLGSLEDEGSRPILDEGAVVHDRDPFADLADDVEIV